jgi:surface polysaccharide O-acyltransferase-like enzyme
MPASPTPTPTPARPQYAGIHLLRALACFMVVMLHASELLLGSFSPRWLAAISYDAFLRSCVPIFLMLSGFLLLDKEEDIFLFYRKRFVRVVVPYLFYAVLYLAVAGVPLLTMPTRLMRGSVAPHMWYIYELIGIYAFLPFFRKVFIHSKTRERLFFVAAWAVFGLLYPLLRTLLGWKTDLVAVYHLASFTGYAGYVFLGACLKPVTMRSAKIALAVYVASSLCILVLTAVFSYDAQKFLPYFIENLSPFVCLAACSLFVLLKDVRPGRLYSVVLAVSDCSYGIYLLHLMLLLWFARLGISGNAGSPWLMIPASACLVFCLTFAIVFALKKVFFLRRLVG